MLLTMIHYHHWEPFQSSSAITGSHSSHQPPLLGLSLASSSSLHVFMLLTMIHYHHWEPFQSSTAITGSHSSHQPPLPGLSLASSSSLHVFMLLTMIHYHHWEPFQSSTAITGLESGIIIACLYVIDDDSLSSLGAIPVINRHYWA